MSDGPVVRAEVATETASAPEGHSSIRVTGDVYSHVVAGLDEDAANVVGGMLLGAPPATG